MDQRHRARDETAMGEYIAKGAMDVQQGILGPAIDKAAKLAPRTMQGLRLARMGPGFILDAASIARSENKPRAWAQAIGGALGTVAGGAVGGGIASPVTSAVGGAAGSWAGGHLYDAGEEIVGDIVDWREDNRRRQDETRRFIDQRNAAERRAYGR